MPTHTSESFGKNLQHFEGLNPDNDTLFHRLTTDEKDSHAKFVNRANSAYATARKAGLPEWFKPYMDEVKTLNRKNAPINFEALYALRTSFGETIWDNDISALIGVPSGPLPNPRWDVKDYTLSSFEWPRLSRSFRNPTFIHMNETSQMNHGIGIYLGMSMSFTELAESGGGLWSPQAVLQNQLAQKFGLVKSRRFFLGSSYWQAAQDDGEDGADLGITGFYNASGIQTCKIGVGDNEVTADGDIEYGIEVGLLPAFSKVYTPHKKVLISTRGYAAESMLQGHRDTYGISDFEHVCKKFFDTGIISDWIVTDQLIVGAAVLPAAAAEQCAMLVGVGEGTMREDIVYPTQTLPFNQKIFNDDLAEVTIFGNITYYLKADTTNNAFPACKADAVGTSTGTGAWLPQGRLDVGKFRRALHSPNA